jgi:hypothetical protein
MVDPAQAECFSSPQSHDLSDLEIRNALIVHLTTLGKISFLIEEFPGAGARLDLLALEGARLAGFEIKSDLDSLRRLGLQVSAYARYCDHLTLVAGRRFAVDLLSDVPPWTGVVLAYRVGSRVALSTLRHPSTNPHADAQGTLSLLRRHELAGGLPPSMQRHHVAKLRQQLEESYSYPELRLKVSAALKRRARERFDAPQRSCGG